MAAHAATHAREAAGENAAAEEAVKLALDEARNNLTASTNSVGEGRAVVADGAMQRRGLSVAGLVASRQRRACLGAGGVPV